MLKLECLEETLFKLFFQRGCHHSKIKLSMQNFAIFLVCPAFFVSHKARISGSTESVIFSKLSFLDVNPLMLLYITLRLLVLSFPLPLPLRFLIDSGVHACFHHLHHLHKFFFQCQHVFHELCWVLDGGLVCISNIF